MAPAFERISKGPKLAALAAAAAAAFIVLVPAARAGSFHVYSCRTPSGGSAPVDGWSGSKAGTYSTAENRCSAPGGALVAGLRNELGRTANTDSATWTVSPPSPETLAGATLWRAGDTAGGAELNAWFQFSLSGPNSNQVFDSCSSNRACAGAGSTTDPLGSQNRVAVPPANLGGKLYIDASCGGVTEYRCKETTEDPNGYAAVVYLYAADLTIEQSAGPTASGVSGELASAPAVGGTSDVAFGAADPGAGVYEAVFSVDGQVVQRTVIDENGGRCRDVGQTTDGTAAFLYLQPCLSSVSADVGFDTTNVANGPHHLLVQVLDAAGNAAPVLDRQVVVANAPAPGTPGPVNGSNASTAAKLTVSWRHSGRVGLTTRYGRAQSIVGRLSAPGGAPISAAQVEARALPAYPGARPVLLPQARTAADGSFSLRLPAVLPSCAVLITYRAHLGDHLASASRTLRLNVHAALALTISPRTASVGRTIFFGGRLLGRPVPRDGKQLVLEARSPGASWIEFEVVRTDSRGRYRAAYRFKFPGPARYEFRVRSEPESDYPFAAGSSRVLSVRER